MNQIHIPLGIISLEIITQSIDNNGSIPIDVISKSTKQKINNSPIVIAVLDRRLKVKNFSEAIPAHLKQTVQYICTDMYDGFVNAAVEVFGAQRLVFDRYHVSKLYRNPLDKLRVKEMTRLKAELSPESYVKLEGLMWLLRKRHECLSEVEKSSLVFIYLHSPALKKTHTYALLLTDRKSVV